MSLPRYTYWCNSCDFESSNDASVTKHALENPFHLLTKEDIDDRTG